MIVYTCTCLSYTCYKLFFASLLWTHARALSHTPFSHPLYHTLFLTPLYHTPFSHTLYHIPFSYLFLTTTLSHPFLTPLSHSPFITSLFTLIQIWFLEYLKLRCFYVGLLYLQNILMYCMLVRAVMHLSKVHDATKQTVCKYMYFNC